MRVKHLQSFKDLVPSYFIQGIGIIIVTGLKFGPYYYLAELPNTVLLTLDIFWPTGGWIQQVYNSLSRENPHGLQTTTTYLGCDLAHLMRNITEVEH